MRSTRPGIRSAEAGAPPAIGHVRHLDAGHALEQLAGEMDRGAGARRREGDLPCRLGIGDELADRAGRRGVPAPPRVGRGEPDEVAGARSAIRSWPSAGRGSAPPRAERSDRHGQAVEIGTGHRLGADIAAGAPRLVLDHHLLAQMSTAGRPDCARNLVPACPLHQRPHDQPTKRFGQPWACTPRVMRLGQAPMAAHSATMRRRVSIVIAGLVAPR